MPNAKTSIPRITLKIIIPSPSVGEPACRQAVAEVRGKPVLFTPASILPVKGEDNRG